MTAPTFDTAIAAEIKEGQTLLAAHEKDRADASAEVQSEKIRQYSRFTALLWSVPVSAGKLSRTNRKALGEFMAHHADMDIDKGKGKRLYEGSVALSSKRQSVLKHGDQSPPTSVDPSWIEARLIEQGITSEAALRSKLFPNASGDEIDAVVRKFVGSLTHAKDEDGNSVPNNIREGKQADKFDELIDRLRTQKRIFDEVRKAAENGVKEAETLARVLETVE